MPSLKTQSTFLFIGQSISYGIQLIIPFILVRLISKNDYGVYLQFLLISETLIPVLCMALPSSLLYFYPTSNENDQKYYIFQTYILLIIISFLFIAIFGLNSNMILSLAKFDYLKDLRFILTLFTAFMLMSMLVDFIFILEKRIYFNLFFYPADKIIKLLMILFFTISIKGFRGCLLALFVYGFLRFIFITVYLFFRYFKKIQFRLQKEKIIAQLGYVIPFAGGLFINTIALRVDKYIVNFYISPAQYAIYAVAFISIPLLHQVYGAISNVAMPQISIYAEKDDKFQLKELWHKIIEKTSSVTIPFVVFFAIMAREAIIFIFTEKFSDSVIYYQIYIFSFLFLMTCYGMILRGYKKTKVIFKANLIGAVVAIAIGFVVIKKYLLMGAIATAFCGLTIPIILTLYYEKKTLNLLLSQWLPWKSIVLIFIIALCPSPVLFVIKWVNIHILLKLVLGAIIYFMLVVAIQYKMKLLIYPELIEFMKKNIRRLRTLFEKHLLGSI